MSATVSLIEAALADALPEGVSVEWTLNGNDPTEAPKVLLNYPDGTTYDATPDEARALGIALIEASGLALGAWGAARIGKGEDDELDEALAPYYIGNRKARR